MTLNFQDYLYVKSIDILPPVVDLRHWDSRVEDQSDLGSCTGATVTGAYELLLKKEQPKKYENLSSLFVYYNARVIEGFVDYDVGAYIRSAIKAAYDYGLCTEAIWPYLTYEFAITPPVECYKDAQHRKIKSYYRLSNLADILDALSRDIPVTIGFRLYQQFNTITPANPIMYVPPKGQDSIGSHAVCLVGYDLERQQLLVKNSFGPNWGMHGYCWMPFEYAENEITDRWVFDIELKETI